MLLAVPGTFITAVVVGLFVSLVLQLPVALALLFGAIVAATDPVAVIGVFKSLRVPGRLAAIAEGESLINDGMAITLYTALVGLALTGTADFPTVVVGFGREVLRGVPIGALLGFVFYV